MLTKLVLHLKKHESKIIFQNFIVKFVHKSQHFNSCDAHKFREVRCSCTNDFDLVESLNLSNRKLLQPNGLLMTRNFSENKSDS